MQVEAWAFYLSVCPQLRNPFSGKLTLGRSRRTLNIFELIHTDFVGQSTNDRFTMALKAVGTAGMGRKRLSGPVR